MVSLLIKLTSKGPIIFKQKRTGKNQKVFTIYKFRTMNTETVKNGIALTDSMRKTKLGQILRKTSIDELPQLFNILIGNMSFIGPRPYLINDIKTYSIEQEIRFKVLPGITSWSAVNGRNSLSLQEKYNFEIYYVKNISLLLDFKIFFKTLIVIFLMKNIDDNTNKQRIAAEIIENEKN
jgi:lipopolysaccharide/colanic/teichoic acid biosynthesis glycosyltransferase